LYDPLADLVVRTSLSRRTIRTWIRDLERPLPAYQIGGKLLFKWAEVETWISGFRVEPIDLGSLANDIIEEMKGKQEPQDTMEGQQHGPSDETTIT